MAVPPGSRLLTMGARVARSEIPLALAALAVALLWFGLFVAGPWFLRHPPGPNNPSFAWYVIFQVFPLALFTVVGILLWIARTAWRRTR